MFEPKKDHPKWLQFLYPYIFFLRYDRRMLLNVLTGRVHFWWHYSWESELEKNKIIDHPDFRYVPGAFIMPQSSNQKK
jgi:uncharacterized RmlC-like cupin family protein